MRILSINSVSIATKPIVFNFVDKTGFFFFRLFLLFALIVTDRRPFSCTASRWLLATGYWLLATGRQVRLNPPCHVVDIIVTDKINGLRARGNSLKSIDRTRIRWHNSYGSVPCKASNLPNFRFYSTLPKLSTKFV